MRLPKVRIVEDCAACEGMRTALSDDGLVHPRSLCRRGGEPYYLQCWHGAPAKSFPTVECIGKNFLGPSLRRLYPPASGRAGRRSFPSAPGRTVELMEGTTDPSAKCNFCGRTLNRPEDQISGDCGGYCWGYIGETETDAVYELSLKLVRQEYKHGLRQGWVERKR